ncbi:MAG: PQQ-binding-like beta-propeller repeat protein [Haloarculaceae archaeon]
MLPVGGAATGGTGWRMHGSDATNDGYRSDVSTPVDGVAVASRTEVGVHGQAAVVDGTVYETVSPDANYHQRSARDDGGRVRARPVGSGSAAWERSFEGDVATAPAVVDGTVYVAHWDGTVRAMDAASGRDRWAVETGLATPVPLRVVDGTVYVTGESDSGGTLAALNAGDGTERWRESDDWPHVPAPAVRDGTVYATVGEFSAFDAATGERGWTAPEVDTSSAPPVAGPDSLYVVGNLGYPDKVLQAVSRADGSVRWRVEPDAYVLSTPVTDGSAVYLGLTDHTVVSYDGASGEKRWTADTVGHVRGQLAVTDEAVFASCDQEYCYAFDRATGSELWRAQLRDRSSIALAGDGVFLGSPAGCTQLGPGSETELVADGSDVVRWRARTDVSTDSPLATNGVNLYFADDYRGVYAYRTGGDDEWETEVREQLRAGPVAGSEHVFVGREPGTLVALDATSGEAEWSADVGDEIETLAVRADGLVVAGGESGLSAHDPGTGDERWRYSTAQEAMALSAVGDAVYAVSDLGVHAVTPAGEKQWQTAVSDELSGVATTGSTVYAASDDQLLALDAEDGSTRWSLDFPDRYVGPPTVGAGTVFLGDWAGRLTAYDAGSGDERWTVDAGADVRNRGAVTDGRFVVGTADERVLYFDVETGDLADVYDATAPLRAAPAVVDEGLVVLDTGGTLHGLGRSSAAGPTPTPTPTRTPSPTPTRSKAGTDAGEGEAGSGDGGGTGDTSTADPSADETAPASPGAPGEGSTEASGGGGPGFGGVASVSALLGVDAWLRRRNED